MNYEEKTIHDLVERFDFNELSPNDRALVLKTMSKMEYQNLRLTAVQTESFFDQPLDIKPKPDTLELLQDRLKKRKATPLLWLNIEKIFTYRLPAYQVGLGLIALFLVFQFLPKKSTPNETSTPTEYVYETIYDTIEHTVVKHIPIDRIVYKTIPAATALTQPTSDKSLQNPNDVPSDNAPLNIQDIQKSMGNSKINQADLDQFRVSM